MSPAPQREHVVKVLGWTGAVLSTLVYISFVDQIRLNLSGYPGSILVPSIAAVSCSIWVAYAWLKTPRDWPIICCNVPGIFLGIATTATGILWR